MSPPRPKDPERVRTGRLGALAVHAAGRTNVGPARTAWLEKIAADAGIHPDLDPDERARRMAYAMRLRMLRLNAARWSKRRPSAPEAA